MFTERRSIQAIVHGILWLSVNLLARHSLVYDAFSYYTTALQVNVTFLFGGALIIAGIADEVNQ